MIFGCENRKVDLLLPAVSATVFVLFPLDIHLDPQPLTRAINFVRPIPGYSDTDLRRTERFCGTMPEGLQIA